MLILDTILRFSMAGMLLPVTVLMLMRHGGHRTIQLGAAFGIGLVAYAFCSMPGREDLLPPWLSESIIFVCISHSAIFWGFAIALFDDHAKIAWRMTAGIILLEATYIGYLLTGPAFADMFTYLRSGLAIILVAHPIYVAFKGRGDDLIEARRTFRVLFVGLAGVYALVQNVTETFFMDDESAVLGVLNIATIWLLTLFLLTKIVHLRPEQFFVAAGDMDRPVAPEPSRKVAPANQALYDALIAHLDEGDGYREPGLTITSLADQLGTQEHRLRRLINQELAYRNFRDFLNGYRLREVRARLSDPGEAHIPVLTIAMDAGFQSLGPFNRAFKEAEGQTPTEFRTGALEAATADSLQPEDG